MMQGAICAGGECCAFPTQAVQRTCIAVKARAAAELPARFWCAQHAQHNQQPSWTASLNSVHCCPKHSVSPLMLLQTQCYVKHSEFQVYFHCLQEWCRRSMAECLAVQPPGRNMRMREQPITSCQHMAAALLPVVASRLCNTPYIVRHSNMPPWGLAIYASAMLNQHAQGRVRGGCVSAETRLHHASSESCNQYMNCPRGQWKCYIMVQSAALPGTGTK